MGSIQALRSEALAMRAKEDTNVQISGYLGGVNKALGNQITQFLDTLQATIKERTKAYNQLMSKINKTILGKDGIGDKAIRAAFGMANAIVGAISGAKGDTWGAAKAAAGILSIAQSYLDILATQETVKSATYDYQKAVSQLGNVGTMSPGDPKVVLPISGAAELLEKRDAIMPRFKPRDNTYAVGSAFSGGPASTWSLHDHRGYIGTLRRV